MGEKSIQDIWAEAAQLVQLEITPTSFDTWIRDLKPMLLWRDKIVLLVPSEFFRRHLEAQHKKLIVSCISTAAKRNMGVVFVLEDELGDYLIEEDSTKSSRYMGGILNPRYTFDTFVVGPGNRFAHAASLAVAEQPGEAYNPLFIYGGVGLGKTHLMQAIGHYVLNERPDANVLYVTSETFTNELIRAISGNKNQEFRNKFRNVDVLMIDDIQFIGAKESTQEEFFHTFNTLHEVGKQIVLSSDKPPKEIPSLEERLRSRFEWGLIADIQKPDLETRIAILQRKATSDHLLVPEDVLHGIAHRVQSNIRELEGSLTRVTAFAAITGRTLAVELIEEVLGGMSHEPVTADRIVQIVSEYYNITITELKSTKRSHDIAAPRQMAMYFMRDMVDMSFPSIGGYFGGKHHTTVIHACDKIATEIKQDRRVQTAVNDIRKRLLEE